MHGAVKFEFFSILPRAFNLQTQFWQKMQTKRKRFIFLSVYLDICNACNTNVTKIIHGELLFILFQERISQGPINHSVRFPV